MTEPRAHGTQRRTRYATARAKGAAIVALLVCAVALSSTATAAPVPSWMYACGDPANNFDPAVCERLTYIASEESTIDANTADGGAVAANLQWIGVGVWFAAGTSFGIWAFARLRREMRGWGGGM